MKVNKTSASSFLYCLLFIIVWGWITGCKKTISSKAAVDSFFSFTYNGTRHVLPFKEGLAEWSVKDSCVFIYRPDIFNGMVHFPYPNCAYLDPQRGSVQVYSNCRLTASGMPIDSVKVYLYESGSVNITYKNCSVKREYDLFSGQYIEYSVCDAEGTFDLTLKNKEGKTIVITEGKFESYRFRI